jgi:hypothetical protein
MRKHNPKPSAGKGGSYRERLQKKVVKRKAKTIRRK